MITGKKLYDAKILCLKACADETAIRFLSPLYLVGSFATWPNEAKDIDILMVTTKDRFIRLFGEEEFNDRQFQFRKKQKLDFEMHLTSADIDFKVVTMEQFIRHKGKKLKLDKIMEFPE